jgi:hypothetical protein
MVKLSIIVKTLQHRSVSIRRLLASMSVCAHGLHLVSRSSALAFLSYFAVPCLRRYNSSTAAATANSTTTGTTTATAITHVSVPVVPAAGVVVVGATVRFGPMKSDMPRQRPKASSHVWPNSQLLHENVTQSPPCNSTPREPCCGQKGRSCQGPLGSPIKVVTHLLSRKVGPLASVRFPKY